MRTTEAPGIEELILKGLEHSVSKYYGVEKTLLVSSSDRNSRLQILTKEKEKSILFPVIFLTLTSGVVSSTYNARSMRRNGTYTGNMDPDTIGKTHLVPVDMSMDVTFITDSFKDSLKFFRMWFLAATAGPLNFNIEYNSLSVLIQTNHSQELNMPVREVSLEAPTYYEITGNLIVHGYVSPDEIEHVPAVTTQTNTGTLKA